MSKGAKSKTYCSCIAIEIAAGADGSLETTAIANDLVVTYHNNKRSNGSDIVDIVPSTSCRSDLSLSSAVGRFRVKMIILEVV
jgi:hypothetical protein